MSDRRYKQRCWESVTYSNSLSFLTVNNFQGKSSTEEICGYIMEPPSEQKCLLSKQDSTDITESKYQMC